MSTRFLGPAALLLALSLLLFPGVAAAYNILTLDMGAYWNGLYDQYFGATQGYGTPGQAGERWYTTVSPNQLASVNLLDYDVFLVQSGFTDDYVTQRATAALDALSAKRDDIRDFVSAGKGLVSWAQPLPDGMTHVWDWAPVYLESAGVAHEEMVSISDPSHPIMQGSTDTSLSNWQSSWHGWFTSYDDRLAPVALTGESDMAGLPFAAARAYGLFQGGMPLTLAGAYNAGGCGKMVFSMQDPDFHAYQQAPGSDDAATFIAASLDWAAEPCAPIPEPTTVGLLGLGLVGWGARRWASRGRRGGSASA